MLIASLNEATRLMNRIYRRSQAKSDTLEKLVPHVNSLENMQQELKEAREETITKEAILRDEINRLRDTNLELRGSISANSNEIDSLKAQLKKAQNENAKLETDKTNAIAELEANKKKSRAQFEVFTKRIQKAESIRDDIANAATPILNAIFQNGLGTSAEGAPEIFDKLRQPPSDI